MVWFTPLTNQLPSGMILQVECINIHLPSFNLRVFRTIIGWLDKKSQWYCWRLKSCTTRDVWNPVNTGINYQPQLVLAGFQSSTVPATSEKVNSEETFKILQEVAIQPHQTFHLWNAGSKKISTHGPIFWAHQLAPKFPSITKGLTSWTDQQNRIHVVL